MSDDELVVAELMEVFIDKYQGGGGAQFRNSRNSKCGIYPCFDLSPFLLLLLQASIWHAIHHYAYSDAIFLAERLYAEGRFLFTKAFNIFILLF